MNNRRNHNYCCAYPRDLVKRVAHLAVVDGLSARAISNKLHISIWDVLRILRLAHIPTHRRIIFTLRRCLLMIQWLQELGMVDDTDEPPITELACQVMGALAQTQVPALGASVTTTDQTAEVIKTLAEMVEVGIKTIAKPKTWRDLKIANDILISQINFAERDRRATRGMRTSIAVAKACAPVEIIEAPTISSAPADDDDDEVIDVEEDEEDEDLDDH